MIVTLVDLLLLKMYTTAYKRLQVLSLGWSSSRLHYKHTAAKKKTKETSEKKSFKRFDKCHSVEISRYIMILVKAMGLWLSCPHSRNYSNVVKFNHSRTGIVSSPQSFGSLYSWKLALPAVR